MDITPLSPVSMTGVRANPEDLYRELYVESGRLTADKQDRSVTGPAVVALIEAVVTQPPPGSNGVPSALNQVA